MKKQIFTLMTAAMLFATTFVNAQAPQGFNYQAVIRDDGGEILSSQSVTIRFTVRTGSATGTSQYQETKNLTTDEFGLVSHVVGTGTVVSGVFSNITWSSGVKYLQVEANTGSGYESLGAQKLMSVPYSLEAEHATSATNATNATTATNSLDNKWNTSGNNISTNNSGNVGIGTTSPSKKLSVYGGGGIAITNDVANWTDRGQLFFYDPDYSNSYAGIKCFQEGGSDQNALSFYTSYGSSTRRMTILSTGNVGIGTSSPDDKLHVDGSTKLNGYTHISPSKDNTSGNVGIGGSTYSNTKLTVASNQDFGLFVDALICDYGLVVEGSAYKTNGGSWIGWSDARLKENVNPYNGGLEELLKIRPVTFHYNELSGLGTEKEYIGVIAQELQEVAPYMVGTIRLRNDEDKTEYLSVDNSAMVYMLINSVKELSQEVEDLKKEIEELKNK